MIFHSELLYEIASGYVMLFPLNPNHTPIISQLYHRFGSYTTIFYGYTTMLMVKFIFLIVTSPICIIFPWEAFNDGVEGQSSNSWLVRGYRRQFFSVLTVSLRTPWVEPLVGDSLIFVWCVCVKVECADLKNFLSQNWMMQKLSWSSKTRICCRCFLKLTPWQSNLRRS